MALGHTWLAHMMELFTRIPNLILTQKWWLALFYPEQGRYVSWSYTGFTATWINEMALLTSFKINKMLEYLGTIYWWFVHKTFLEFYFNTCRLPNQPHILSRVYKKGFEKLRLNGRVVVNVEDFRVYDLCVKMKKKVWYISLEIVRMAHKKWTTKEQHFLA